MSQFRLVVLDNTKEQLDNPVAQKILGDMLFAKQTNFLRTDPRYVVMDKHDMIGTHYLIYDTTDFVNPKLIFAIRTTFLGRAQDHRLETPLMCLLPTMSKELQDAFTDFHKNHPQLVDCNAWFVDPTYSKKNSGMNLSDLGYLMVSMNCLRHGYNNIVGCTNETYNASRWLEKVGNIRTGLMFEHPVVKAPHKMILLDDFNFAHFSEVYQMHKDLVDGIFEVSPKDQALTSLASFAGERLSFKPRGVVRAA